jgi:hypothetical protein
MGTGKPRISTAVRVLVLIALAEELGTDQVRAELELALVEVLELVIVLAKAAPLIALAEVLVLVIVLAEPALAIVPGVVLVLVIVLAKVALLIALVEVLELVIVLAKAALLIALAEVREPETVQVEAVPVRSHLRALLAVPLRIKSVTGPRRHDQVLPLTVEDLAVEVVETTRDPAVTEAAIAWAAAE